MAGEDVLHDSRPTARIERVRRQPGHRPLIDEPAAERGAA